MIRNDGSCTRYKEVYECLVVMKATLDTKMTRSDGSCIRY